MGASVYVETSIISYLVARLSRDLIVAGHQQITHEWWDRHRSRFQVFASLLVTRECAIGDPAIARKRLELLHGMELLEVTSEAIHLAREFVEHGPLPPKAEMDAAHIALAAVQRIDYLLTWNCRHIANAEMQPALQRICRSRGHVLPTLCTPEQLMGG
jgi:hypothetical protein